MSKIALASSTPVFHLGWQFRLGDLGGRWRVRHRLLRCGLRPGCGAIRPCVAPGRWWRRRRKPLDRHHAAVASHAASACSGLLRLCDQSTTVVMPESSASTMPSRVLAKVSWGRNTPPSWPRMRAKYWPRVQSQAMVRSAVCHRCRWLSTNPGRTIRLRASTTSASEMPSSCPTAEIRSPSISRSPRVGCEPGRHGDQPPALQHDPCAHSDLLARRGPSGSRPTSTHHDARAASGKSRKFDQVMNRPQRWLYGWWGASPI